VTENGAADRDRTIDRWQTMAVGMVQGVEDLTVYIELRLVDRRVPDAHWAGFFVARQPRRLPLD
jgi:hypothetical protein